MTFSTRITNKKRGYKTEIVPTTYMVQTLNKKWIFPLMISSFFVQWGPLFRLMVLFELLSSWSWWDWPLSLSQVLISLLKYLYLNFFINRVWKWIEETRPKRCWNKIWICQIGCDFFTLFNFDCKIQKQSSRGVL